MAVINSVGVGRGEKSVGEFTYRRARGGRTIAARRVIENKSNTPAQAEQRKDFAKASSLIKFIPKRFLELMSVKSKTGSARNKFLSENYDACLKWWWNDSVKGYGTVGAAIQRICTTTDPANENPFTPVVGDLQPVANSYDESTGVLTLAVRVREGIKRMNLSLIACMDTGFVNLASFNLTPSSSSSSDTPGTVTPDPAPAALDEGIELLNAQNPATGVTVDSDGTTVTVTINTKTYIRSVTTLTADTSYGIIPSLKVNDRLVSVYRAPGVHVTNP